MTAEAPTAPTARTCSPQHRLNLRVGPVSQLVPPHPGRFGDLPWAGKISPRRPAKKASHSSTSSSAAGREEALPHFQSRTRRTAPLI